MEKLLTTPDYAWFKEHLPHCSYDISIGISRRMKMLDVALPEIYDVVSNGAVRWVASGYHGWEFEVAGFTYDDRRLAIFGWFDPSNAVLFINAIGKT